MLSRKEMAELRAREIYKVAAEILCDLGYERASIRDIAEATGFTKAGLYYYFKSKEHLLFIILDGYMDELLEGVSALAQEVEEPKERLKSFIHFQVKLYSQEVHRSKLILHEENCLSGQWLETVKGKQKQYLGFWRNALQQYAEQKGFKIPQLSAHVMLLTGMCNWIYQWYDPQGSLSPDDLAELIFDLFLKGIEAS